MVRTSLLILALGLVSTALAQDSSGSSFDVKTATPDEMRAFATSSAKTVKENAAAIEAMALDAKNSSDSRLLSCISPKARAAGSLKPVVDLSMGRMERNLNGGGEEGSVVARFEIRKIEIAVGNSTKFLAEAKKCSDSEGDGKTGSSVVVTGGFGDDSDTVDNDALDEFDINVNPPQISPFMP